MQRISTAAAALILPLLVASCATLPGMPITSGAPDAALHTDADVGPEGRADTAELLARIDQLEQDLAEMRIEMSRIVPAIERLNANTSRNELNRMGDNGRDEPVIAAAINDASMFSVHLASYRSADTAREGWEELRRRFGPVLASLEPRLAEVNIEDRGTFYRLKAGPFENWGGANEVCDYLRGESWSCAVMDFTGVTAE